MANTGEDGEKALGAENESTTQDGRKFLDTPEPESVLREGWVSNAQPGEERVTDDGAEPGQEENSSAAFDRKDLDHLDLSKSEKRIVAALEDNGGEVPKQRVIVKEAGMNVGTVSSLLKRLADRGL